MWRFTNRRETDENKCKRLDQWDRSLREQRLKPIGCLTFSTSILFMWQIMSEANQWEEALQICLTLVADESRMFWRDARLCGSKQSISAADRHVHQTWLISSAGLFLYINALQCVKDINWDRRESRNGFKQPLNGRPSSDARLNHYKHTACPNNCGLCGEKTKARFVLGRRWLDDWQAEEDD